MAFTEFFCRASGSNLNGGGLATGLEPATAAAYTSTSGNWDGTSIFIPTDGSTPASTVAVGDFASVYNDGATLAVYIARVTVVAAGVNGQITLSTTAFSGTAPTSNATQRSIKVGGAWLGPNAGVNFPFNFVTNVLTDASGNPPRVNFKNDQTYNITTGITHSLVGFSTFQGYTASAGDLGKATIDGGTSGIVLMTLSAARGVALVDLIIQNNGGAGTQGGISNTGCNILQRVVCSGVRGTGISMGSGPGVAIECEAYSCNAATGAGRGGFAGTGAGTIFLRCISHDNSVANTNGFITSGNAATPDHFVQCIADTNALNGFFIQNRNTAHILINCDAYNNGGDGFTFTGATNGSALYLENCNAVKNTGFGFNRTDSVADYIIMLMNCGFGSGSQVNGGGDTNGINASSVIGKVTYASGVTPWNAPVTGDFSITLAAAKAAGRGSFTETQASYTGTAGFPCIGAAQPNAGLGGSIIRGIIGA